MTERFLLSRETLASGELSPHLQAAHDAGLIDLLPDDEREANRRVVLAAHPQGEDLHIFGIGSLMWNPACDVAELCPALVRGWHRRFSLWTLLGRGTPELPGLTLGLEAGGSCRGVALRIAAEKIESETRLVWRREMLSGAYNPVWVTAELADRTVRAVGFAIDKTYDRYDGRVPFDQQAYHLGCAEGPLGPNIEYLENTVEILESMGQTRGVMHNLLKAASRRRRQRDSDPMA